MERNLMNGKTLIRMCFDLTNLTCLMLYVIIVNRKKKKKNRTSTQNQRIQVRYQTMLSTIDLFGYVCVYPHTTKPNLI